MNLDTEAFAAGRRKADEDIASGKLGYRAYGNLVPSWSDVADLLREEYGIVFSVVGACITDIKVAAEADGYNQRMIEAFIDRFDEDVVETTFRKVERKRK